MITLINLSRLSLTSSSASLTFRTVQVFLLLSDEHHNLLPESAERPLLPLKLFELITHLEQ
ncbi:uncharacterized protein N7503_008471 [Penicillium pulvis]|uniref:uncharacterized protein n=1 Tax=Penicillium pulvis TaxID=1562058 RepID=UPI002546C1B2|nr:uncharacterized protein N7503_008471 [Penicillium pulvis]KAJ5792493.1 hypothetical protein N7503_008471 [Penicillium pulvis]